MLWKVTDVHSNTAIHTVMVLGNIKITQQAPAPWASSDIVTQGNQIVYITKEGTKEGQRKQANTIQLWSRHRRERLEPQRG